MENYSTVLSPKQAIDTIIYTRIICPVDFSDAAINAVEYASIIAGKLSLELLLLNVKPLLSSELIGGNADLLGETTLDAKEKLNRICTEINTTVNISCNSEVIITPSRFEQIISHTANEKSIIVMGTNGIDNLTQYFFGTHTFNVLNKSKCPVLLVPEGVLYAEITEFVYVLGNKERSKNYLEQAIHFAQLFGASIKFLNINRDNPKDTKKLHNVSLEVAEILMEKKNIRYSIESVNSEDIAEVTNRYMSKKDNSVLIFPVAKRSVVENIFKKNNIKDFAATTSYPVIFIHEEENIKD